MRGEKTLTQIKCGGTLRGSSPANSLGHYGLITCMPETFILLKLESKQTGLIKHQQLLA